MKRPYLFIFFSLLFSSKAFSQTPFIRLVQPEQENIITSASQQFIAGSTCPTCRISINGKEVKVYSTGAFAIEVDLMASDSNFIITSTAPSGKKSSTTIYYSYRSPQKEQSTQSFQIASIEIKPEGDLMLAAGDEISFRVKAMPG